MSKKTHMTIQAKALKNDNGTISSFGIGEGKAAEDGASYRVPITAGRNLIRRGKAVEVTEVEVDSHESSLEVVGSKPVVEKVQTGDNKVNIKGQDVDLDALTADKLKALAETLGIEFKSKDTKADLINKIKASV